MLKKTIQAISRHREVVYNYKPLPSFIKSFLVTSFFFVAFHQIIKYYLWPSLDSFGSKRSILFWGAIVLNLIVYLFLNLIFYILYISKIKAIEEVKVLKNKKWDWEVDAISWKILIKRCIIGNLINDFLATPFVSYIALPQEVTIQFEFEKWPSPLTIFLQFCFFLLIQDFIFYCVHRSFHHPKLYPWHKQHHQFHQVVGLAAQYSHPVDHFFTGLIPGVVGYSILDKLIGVHYSTILIWVMFRIVHSFIAHCGYYFSFDPAHLAPIFTGSHYHSFHHSGNCSNFGSQLLIWDILLGTIQPYVDELNKETNKYLQKEKAK